MIKVWEDNITLDRLYCLLQQTEHGLYGSRWDNSYASDLAATCKFILKGFKSPKYYEDTNEWFNTFNRHIISGDMRKKARFFK